MADYLAIIRRLERERAEQAAEPLTESAHQPDAESGRLPALQVSFVGRVVLWDSPLFGLLSAVVLDEQGDSVTVRHPLTEVEATSPKRWLTEQDGH